MAKQTIILGTTANDGTGTTLRVGGDIINDNFTELYSYLNVGLFAALTHPEPTTIRTPYEYEYIRGNFSNSPAIGFIGTEVPEPAIIYTSEQTMYFEISAHATLNSTENNTKIFAGIKKNGTLVDDSVMSLFAKQRTEPYTFGGVCVVSLEKNDSIQMVVTADLSCDIEFMNLTATIRPFILQ